MTSKDTLKIVTWNINGLRSFGGSAGWAQIFSQLNADILCFQETKIPRSSIEDWMAFVPDYTSYFSFPQGQLRNSGYSGVASYCKESSGTRPIASDSSFFVTKSEIFGDMEFDEDDELLLYSNRWPEIVSQHDSLPIQCSASNLWRLADSEGRCLVTKHQFIDESCPDETKYLYIFNLYCPRNDLEKIERQHYQLRFYHMLEKRTLQILNQSPNNHVIILGDLNTTHGPNDVYDDTQWCYEGSHGRKWLQDLLNIKKSDSNDNLFVDAFRYLHPDETKSFTCWNVKLGCRITNFGSRLDYIVIDFKLLPYLHDCFHLSDFQGSDHCPVVIEFKSTLKTKCLSNSFSSNCTKSWPEFGSGSSQCSIKQFFTKRNIDCSKTTATTTPAKATNTTTIAAISTKTSFKSKNKKQTQSSMQQFIKTFKKTNDSQEHEHESEYLNKITSESSQNSIKIHNSGNHLSNGGNVQNAWKAIFKKPEVPNCSGHNLPCVRRKSKKAGQNFGKEFFSCPKSAMEPKGHPETNCGFFRWLSK